MRKRVIRRGQLIAPFGPGAMIVTPDGVSLIGAGLDHWFKKSDGSRKGIDPNEFQVSEWRLEKQLKTDFFCLPPDYRSPRQEFGVAEQSNVGLTVPFLRFPRWHVCPKCHQLKEFPLDLDEVPRCPSCSPSGKAKRSPAMIQVRFIAMCDHGHIQDFPWREWVHESASPNCPMATPMKMYSGSGASLASIRVTCGCGKSRTLDRITEIIKEDDDQGPRGEDEEGQVRGYSTYLSKRLDPKEPFLCPGIRPWLGEDEDGEGCGRPLLGSLRGATNVHYARVRSSIYLPRAGAGAPPELIELLESPRLWGMITLRQATGAELTPSVLRDWSGAELAPYEDKEIASALKAVLCEEEAIEDVEIPEDDPETAFRRAEHGILRTERDEAQLRTKIMDLSAYDPSVVSGLARITLVETLRETRVLTGFSRVFAEDPRPPEAIQASLWKVQPGPTKRWLPGYIVLGEGIYLEFDEGSIADWMGREGVTKRILTLNSNYAKAGERRRLRPRPITPRLVLVHTLAHLLMNQLTFECGYSTASLRERLYVSSDQEHPMAGILIYTAAGDSEGSMGGLVRMGKPGNLEPIILRALRNATWCSTDPVCMEMGDMHGQGPDSCNLAACHNCALVPETSCEEFNRFLDRALVVGTFDNPRLGFFSEIRKS